MTRKLFTVKVQTELVVLAYDEEHAERTAKHVAQDEWPARDLSEVHFSCEARPLRDLPLGCNLDDCPEENTVESPEFLELPERTVRQWIALGAAPGYLRGQDSAS